MKRVTVLLAAMLLVLVAAAPAAAKPLVQERYEGGDAGTWSCGGPIYEYEGSWSGKYTLKEGRGGDPTPYVTDNYEWDWVNRNPANGKYFTEHGQVQYKDVKITLLYGTVYRIIAQETGLVYVIETSDGTTVQRNRGLVRYEHITDTQGDADLTNDVWIDSTIVAEHPYHPFWHMTDDEYCALVNELLG